MASVRERSPGRWQIRAFVGRDPLTGEKIYESQTIAAGGKREATLEANRWELELRDGELTGQGGTLRQLADRWLAQGERIWSPNTISENNRIVRTYLRRPLGHVDVDKIRTQTLDELYGELAARGGRCTRRPCPRPANCGVDGHPKRCQRVACVRAWRCPTHAGACSSWTPCDESPCAHGGPLSISSVHRIHGVISSMLEQAVRWGWVRRNVAELANPGTILEDEITPPDELEVIPLLAELEEADVRLADYVALAIETGARRGAMHALRLSYVDLDVGTVRFPRVIAVARHGAGRGQRRPGETLVDRPGSKNKRTARQAIAISPYTVARLRAHRARMAERALAAGAALPEDAYIWSDHPLGQTPWHPDSTSRRFRFVRGGAGLDETRLHDMRHLMASVLLGHRVDPKVIGQRGAWSRLATMLDRYAHAVPAGPADREAAAIMGRVLAGPGG